MDDDALAAPMQRFGGWCAMVGAALLIAAGIGFGGLTFGREPEAVLQAIAAQPRWYWPAVHLAVAAGAVLWIGAFIALNSSFRETVARLLGSLGVVSIVLGAALHVIDSFISASVARSDRYPRFLRPGCTPQRSMPEPTSKELIAEAAETHVRTARGRGGLRLRWLTATRVPPNARVQLQRSLDNSRALD